MFCKKILSWARTGADIPQIYTTSPNAELSTQSQASRNYSRIAWRMSSVKAAKGTEPQSSL